MKMAPGVRGAGVFRVSSGCFLTVLRCHVIDLDQRAGALMLVLTRDLGSYASDRRPTSGDTSSGRLARPSGVATELVLGYPE